MVEPRMVATRVYRDDSRTEHPFCRGKIEYVQPIFDGSAASRTAIVDRAIVETG